MDSRVSRDAMENVRRRTDTGDGYGTSEGRTASSRGAVKDFGVGRRAERPLRTLHWSSWDGRVCDDEPGCASAPRSGWEWASWNESDAEVEERECWAESLSSSSLLRCLWASALRARVSTLCWVRGEIGSVMGAGPSARTTSRREGRRASGSESLEEPRLCL